MPTVDDQASVVALIQAVIPLGLQAVGEVLEAEVTKLAGERYGRTGGHPGLVRGGQQPGSVYLLDQKLPIRLPAGAGSDPDVNDHLKFPPMQSREIPLPVSEQLFVRV